MLNRAFRTSGRFLAAAALVAFACATSTDLRSQAAAAAEKRPLTHADYDAWPSIRSTAVSRDGKWIAYAINPAWGDGVLHVREVDGDKEFTQPRGRSPKFCHESRYVVFTVGKSAVEERRKAIDKLHGGKSKEVEAEAKKKAEEAEKAAEERRERMMAAFRAGRRMPPGGFDSGDSNDSSKLAILDLTNGEVEYIENLKGHRLDRDGKRLLYHLEAPKQEKDDNKKDADEGAESSEGARRRGRGEGRRARSGRGGGSRSEMRQRMRERFSRGRGRRGRSDSDDKGGTPLVVRELATGTEQRFEGVLSYDLLADDRWLRLTSKYRKPEKRAARKRNSDDDSEHEGKESGEENEETGEEKHDESEAKAEESTEALGTVLADGLHAIEFSSGQSVKLVDGAGSFRSFTTDKHKRRLAFASNVVEKLAQEAEAKRKKEQREKKTKESKEGESKEAEAKEEDRENEEEKKDPRYDIYLWSFDGRPATRVITHDHKGLPEHARLQSSGLSFSDDGSVLRFGIKGAEQPELPKILPEEKVVVDIWHWQDGQIQPMQAKSGRRDRDPTHTAVLHLDEDRIVVLGDEKMPSARLITRDGSRAIATDSKPYEILMTWDGSYSDSYLVNTIDGSRKLIRSKGRTRVAASPSGRWLTYFGDDYEWYVIDVASMEERCLTRDVNVHWQNELEDRPQPASAYGIAGWTEGDTHVLINDRWDIWKFNVATGDSSCLTDGYGRANKIVLRYDRFDIEADDDDRDPMLRDYVQETIVLSAKNDVTKARGYYTDSTTKLQKPKQLVMMDATIRGLRRAKNAERLFFTRSTAAEFPDIWTADLAFGDMKKLTDACPMQREVRWGKAELVHWHNDDGVALQGILVKPDGFDPKKKYPMMVYFYERNADNLHRYRAPTPGTSPNQAYYVSNGYLWFVPDIVYTVGYPGESAEKCVISGVQHLIAQGFVDAKAIGCAGHSWGGYQTAHLVTRTNLFAAAESGAPVSNMFSAYGGIRYSSGRSRQFQYERTQSRIGGTPWEYPQRYWQNSPVFYADRVETPVLILHNDEDGAVPWTNGIEFFMALRRLGKESYLFNYNGDAHGLRKKPNQKDWTRRMAEFFDHHLKGAPAPAWMREGVKYIDREREKIRFAPSFVEASAKGSIEPEVVEAVGGGGGER